MRDREPQVGDAGLEVVFEARGRGVEPKDEIEAMLAAQMAAVHMATMTFAAHSLCSTAGVGRAEAEVPGENALSRGAGPC
jgi:hypothetical protein